MDPQLGYSGMNSGSNSPSDSYENFEFQTPPEAPFFIPSREEFLDPLEYINKIRPIAERSGICRIRPPDDWQPPFAVDIGSFKFTPRVQRLNELEAKTRIKLNFLTQIAKFWELQGSNLKIPMVERKILDLYTLHQIVQSEGGCSAVCSEKSWCKVANRMGMPNGKGIATLLKTHYEKILAPFDIFQATKLSKENHDESYLGDSKNDLKKCHMYESKPKIENCTKASDRKKIIRKNSQEIDPLAKYICKTCHRGDVEESMLLCDGCDDSYHTFCLTPPLTEIPKGDWRCPKCLAEEVSKPLDPFGFVQAQREYTLQQFGEMADQFKANYFNMPVHRVPLPLTEKEFWRIVSSIDEDVTVEYGADLHSVDHGSGFPTKNSINADKENADIKQYVDSPWNLNNLPILEGSVLKHISANISGMKVPWMYVGMCFATFCWHNEDHWSYSINYLHWGEPKTWYGVPGSYAENFESTMKKVAPELFHTQPDLLHQLTTIMNPNVLMKAGVPVFRTDQQAGEFVITFPRAYHAGFNQGYNFAEAVNFAPGDWLRMGRECIARYASLHRYCVFSHDELVCKIALNAENTDPRIAAASYQDMLNMVETEKCLRKKLLEWGVSEAEREAYELVPDDVRQCDYCKTTCFLSAVTCKCSTDKLVCLQHYNQICNCPPSDHILRYRYTMDELPLMLQKLKNKAESYESWLRTVKKVVDHKSSKNMDLHIIKSLLSEAKEKCFPVSDVFRKLIVAVQEAEKCTNIARRLKSNKLRIRTRVGNEKKMTLEELILFIEQIDNLVCKIDETEYLKSWLHQAQHFKKHASLLLNMDSSPIEQLKCAVQEGIALNLELKELDLLNKKISVLTWVELVDKILSFNEDVEKQELISLIKEGSKLLKKHKLNKNYCSMIENCISKLQVLMRLAEKWETKAENLLNSKSEVKLQEFENHLIDGNYIPVKLESHNKLANAVSVTKAWYRDLETICENNIISTKDEIQQLIKRAMALPININVEHLENSLKFRDKWIAEVCQAFLKNEDQNLIEVLFPQIKNILCDKKEAKSFSIQEFPLKNMSSLKTDWFNSFYQKAALVELIDLKKLRHTNKEKQLNRKDVFRQCFCKTKKKSLIVKCIVCTTSNHEVCLSKKWRNKYKTVHSSIVNYICSECERSKRPPINVIKSLIADLQNTNLKFPEGEALKLLMERIRSYKFKVEKILSRKNLLDVKTLKNYQKHKNVTSSLKDENSVMKELNLTQDLTSKDMQHNYIYSRSFFQSELVRNSARQLKDSDIALLKTLLHEGSAIEASIIHTSLLLKLLNVAKEVSKESPKKLFVNAQTKQEKHMRNNETSDSENAKNHEKKKRIKLLSEDDSEEKLVEQNSSLGKEIERKTTPKSISKKSSDLPLQHSKRNRAPIKSNENEDYDDEDEDCAVPNCLHPGGVKVDWVQCDQCLSWYHLLCIKLKKCDIKEDQDFFCENCRNNSRFPRRCKK